MKRHPMMQHGWWNGFESPNREHPNGDRDCYAEKTKKSAISSTVTLKKQKIGNLFDKNVDKK